MIRTNQGEQFPILVSLLDEGSGSLSSGRTVYFDIRDMLDNEIYPPVSGTLTESTIEPGIYKTTATIEPAGTYIIYCTCSGFISNTEEVIVNQENIYEVTKQNRVYNTYVEDVVRTTASGNETASQIIRKVGYGKTDYIITKIKEDTDANWDNPVSSGIAYAHYNSTVDDLPYKMSGDGL